MREELRAYVRVMERRPPPAPLNAWAILSLCGTVVAEDMMGDRKLINTKREKMRRKEGEEEV